jgi:alkanesulfonate monooxygenase SsuD/methylene tetrahydromethanopterin reductase-like flavin-dependent oxidoreductase (luciferase family)
LPPSESDIRRATAYGTPDDVVEQMSALVDVLAPYPDGHLIVRLHYPGMDVAPAARALELFAREVAPRLKDRAGRT